MSARDFASVSDTAAPVRIEAPKVPGAGLRGGPSRSSWLAPLVASLALLTAFPGQAAPVFDLPVRVTQPDGTELRLLASGDEFSNRLHDARGFTVVRRPDDGVLVYAARMGDHLVPTTLVVGRDDPVAGGLRPGLVEGAPVIEARRMIRQPVGPVRERAAPLAGTLNNLVLFIRFADESEFVEPLSMFQTMFNDLDGAPSLRAYYREVSYGRLDVETHFLPTPQDGAVVSFQSPYPRAYYRPYNRFTNPTGYTDQFQAIQREQSLVKQALTEVMHQIPEGLDLDGDNDGNVDNVVVIVSGGPDGWSDLLWPHMSLLLADVVTIGDLMVMAYNWLMVDFLDKGREVGVLAHEMFHTLGAPDLYHYNHDGLTPIGPWDLMEWDASTPQHTSAWMKHRYGRWIDQIPEITTSGRYTLNPLTEPTGQAYRISIPENPRQFFVLEYRRAHGPYESSLPDSGLLVHRIDSRRSGNASGPPDEVYTLRPGGLPKKTGEIRNAALSAASGRTSLSLDTDPFPFLADGTRIGLQIDDVSEAGETLSFSVCLRFQACWKKNCGEDGCGGLCGTCDPAQVCDVGVCSEQQGCATYAACLATCGDDAACRDWCGRVPVVCAPATKCHEEGSCNLETGACEYPVMDDGEPCDDGNACTRLDECQAGACVGSDPVLCPEAETCWYAGTCSPRTGECTVKAALRGTECDDEDPCTRNDVCNGKGTCAGTAYDCPSQPCRTAIGCDGAGGCLYQDATPGDACDDADPCTADDVCDASGACAGTPFACESTPCATARCADGGCAFDPVPEGTSCDDRDPCTLDDACDGQGTCIGTPDPICNPAPDVVDPTDPGGSDSGTSQPISPASSSCSGGTGTASPAGILLLTLGIAAALLGRRRARRTAC